MKLGFMNRIALGKKPVSHAAESAGVLACIKALRQAPSDQEFVSAGASWVNQWPS